jgi:hypothetical protein
MRSSEMSRNIFLEGIFKNRGKEEGNAGKRRLKESKRIK